MHGSVVVRSRGVEAPSSRGPARDRCSDRTVDRLVAAASSAVISVVAPAGYGKTTFLAQWAERKKPRVGWVSVDDRDNDPVVLLTYIAVALDRIEAIDPRVFRALASSGAGHRGSAVAGRGDGQDAAPGRARHRQLGSGHEPGEPRRGRCAGTGTADGLAARHRFAGHVALANRRACARRAASWRSAPTIWRWTRQRHGRCSSVPASNSRNQTSMSSSSEPRAGRPACTSRRWR